MAKFSIYLPSGYRRSNVTQTVGRARSGEIAPQGLVSQTEFWDGRMSATVQRSTVRYVREPDGHIRPMTFKETVDKGYFILGQGPAGMNGVTT